MTCPLPTRTYSADCCHRSSNGLLTCEPIEKHEAGKYVRVTWTCGWEKSSIEPKSIKAFDVNWAHAEEKATEIINRRGKRSLKRETSL